MESKTLGWIQIVGAVLAVLLNWQFIGINPTTVFAALFLIMGYHHITE